MLVGQSCERGRGRKELTVSWALRSAGGSRGREWRRSHSVRVCVQTEGFREACEIGRCSCCICRESEGVIAEAGGTNLRSGVARFEDEKGG